MVNKVTLVMATNSQRLNADLWGRFRFSVVGPILSSPPAHGELKPAIRSLAAKTWTHPVNGKDVQFSVGTIERWYYRARNDQDDPVGVLRQAVRKDCGKVSITPALIECLANQYRDCAQWTYQLHYDNLRAMVKADERLGPLPSYSTVRRYMVAQGMIRKPRLQPKASRREIERLELKAWLLDIVLSRTTPENLRNELTIENLDLISEVARNGAVDLRKRALAWLDVFNAQTRVNGEGPVIEFVPLPSRAQFLNVIESVFSGMKRAVIHHSDYGSEYDMKSAISAHFVERNEHFKHNPRRVGRRIWEIDFFNDFKNILAGDYREW